MTFTRNPLDTFESDLTSKQMADDQKAALQAGLATDGGKPEIVAAFLIHDAPGVVGSIIPLGVDQVDEDDMWHHPIRVQVTYEVDSTDQDDLRSTLIQIHQDLIVNGRARAIAADEAEKQRVRNMVREAEQKVAEAQAEYERLVAYAGQQGIAS